MKFSSQILMVVFAALSLVSCDEEQLITEPGKLVPLTVDEDSSLPSITVNGAMLHSEAFGHPDSTMIVCIHGGPGGDYRYMLNARDLANHGYRVIFYDQRGSGLSQRFSKKSYTSLGLGALDVLYDELSGVIAHYRTSPEQKVFLLGHSWGGILATGYAGKHPDAIQALVVCEPGGLIYDDILDYVERSRSFKIWDELLNDVAYLDQFITGKEDEHEILDYKLGILASTNEITGESNVEPGSVWRSGAVISEALFEIGDDYRPDFSEHIDQFEVPVLFFYSEKNQAYPDSWAQKISGAYNSAYLIKIPGVGHDGIIKEDHAWTTITMPEMISYFNSIQ